jgi:type II secretory pathway pseudopilin PulG
VRQQVAVTARRGGEAGASLVEILVAVGIISTALVILVAALSTGAFAVRNADQLTTATNLATSQLESIKAEPYDPAGAYDLVDRPSGYTIAIDSNQIITGLQQVTVTVSFDVGAVTVSNYKVSR